MLNVFKTMLLSAAFLSGIFASNEIEYKPESPEYIDSSINHSTFVNAPSTPPRENSSPKRTVIVKQVATTSQPSNPEDDDCVVIETPQSTPHEQVTVNSLGVTPDYNYIQSANSTASNTPTSNPSKQPDARQCISITPTCSDIHSNNSVASSTPREQTFAATDPKFTNNSALANHMQMVRAGVFSEK
jgi:hypothetical protein